MPVNYDLTGKLFVPLSICTVLTFQSIIYTRGGPIRREIRLEFRRGCLTADNAGGRMMYRRQEVGRS